MTQYKYKFLVGFHLIEEGEKDMRYIRMRGKELAEQLGQNVRDECYNDYLHRWEYLGTSQPDGLYIDSFGCTCKLDEDGNNYRVVKSPNHQ